MSTITAPTGTDTTTRATTPKGTSTGASFTTTTLGTARLADAVRRLADEGIPLDDVGLRRPTLDEVFLALTGRPPATPTADDGIAA